VVRPTRVSTPPWVRAIVVAVLVGVPGWLLLQYHDRKVNEARLAKLATEIAGRPVQIDCPGVFARLVEWDFLEGSVQFDASGRPSDTAVLRSHACAELDALAEGRRQAVLACVAVGGACGVAGDQLAMAVDVITHESFHLAGILDEAETECRSLHAMGRSAERLGATPAEGRALALHHFQTSYQLMPARYRTPPCEMTGL
jgi:hypothetical protein